jgi:hypothetical protein
MTSRTFQFTVQTPGSWFDGLTPGVWTKVAAGSSGAAGWQQGTRISDIPLPMATSSAAPDGAAASGTGTDREAIWREWTGSMVDQTRKEYLFVAMGGGSNTSYYGNEVYALALNVTQPKWYVLQQATPRDVAATNPPPSPLGKYSDSRMASAHHWARGVFAYNSGVDKAWYHGVHAATPLDSGSFIIFSYNRAASYLPQNSTQSKAAYTAGNPWTSSASYGNAGDAYGTPGAYSKGQSVYDPVKNRVWAFPSETPSSPAYCYDGTTGVYLGSITATGTNAACGSWAVLDETNRYIYTDNYYDVSTTQYGSVMRFNIGLADNAATPFAITNTTPGAATVIANLVNDPPQGMRGSIEGKGAVFHAGKIYQMQLGHAYFPETIPDYALAKYDPATRVWTSIALAPGLTQGVDYPRTLRTVSGAGLWSKFNIVRNMNIAGDACFVAYTGPIAGPTWVMRVTSSGL